MVDGELISDYPRYKSKKAATSGLTGIAAKYLLFFMR